MAEPHVSAVLLAAGRSARMTAPSSNGAEPEPPRPRKPFLVLGGRTVLEVACAAFEGAQLVSEIVLVGHADDLEQVERLTSVFAKVRACVVGGAGRTDSVRCGVAATSHATRVVLIHDVARPLVLSSHIDQVARATIERGAALLAAPVSDTIKASPDGDAAVSTLDRSILWAAQTPQGFDAQRLAGLLVEAERDEFAPTDDAALWERYVGPVAIVRGDASNLKLTTAADLVIAEALLSAREDES